MADEVEDNEAVLGMVLCTLRDVVRHDGGPVLTARLVGWVYGARPVEAASCAPVWEGLREATRWTQHGQLSTQVVGTYLGRNRGRCAAGLRLDRARPKRGQRGWSRWMASPCDAPVPVDADDPPPMSVTEKEERTEATKRQQRLIQFLENPNVVTQLEKIVEALSKKRKPRKKQKVSATTLLIEDEYTLLKAAHQRLGITRVSGVLGIRSESIREILAIDRVTVRTAERVREGLPKLRSVLATTKPKVKRPKRVHLVLADDELRKKLIALKPFVSISQLSFVLSTRPLTVRSIISGYRKMHQSLLEDIRARVDLLLKPPYVDLRGALVVPSQQVLETLRLGFLPPLPGFTAAETERFVIDSTRDR